jgi:hypothetical protein
LACFYAFENSIRDTTVVLVEESSRCLRWPAAASRVAFVAIDLGSRITPLFFCCLPYSEATPSDRTAPTVPCGHSATSSIDGPVEGCMTCSPTSADHRPGPFMLRRAVAVPSSAQRFASSFSCQHRHLLLECSGCDCPGVSSLKVSVYCAVFSLLSRFKCCLFIRHNSTNTKSLHIVRYSLFCILCECCALLCVLFLFG